ncbi:hypothetical protein J6590_093949, partial [Homalodisca vitripennis]
RLKPTGRIKQGNSKEGFTMPCNVSERLRAKDELLMQWKNVVIKPAERKSGDGGAPPANYR